MNIIIKGASGFMGLFDTGAETFVSWVSGIVPKVLLLLILMNTIIALIGQERVNKFAKLCSGNVGARQVKWLTVIRLSGEESPSHWQQKDYR